MSLTPFDTDQAELVASWAAGDADVVRAWIAIEADQVAADVVAGWSDDDDVEAYVFSEGDGHPVAYGELWLDHESGDVELAHLLVAPDRRGQGVGRVFVRALTEHARQAHPELSPVVLRVQPDNARAIRAYGAAGFVDLPPDQQMAWNEGERYAYHWMVVPDQQG